MEEDISRMGNYLLLGLFSFIASMAAVLALFFNIQRRGKQSIACSEKKRAPAKKKGLQRIVPTKVAPGNVGKQTPTQKPPNPSMTNMEKGLVKARMQSETGPAEAKKQALTRESSIATEFPNEMLRDGTALLINVQKKPRKRRQPNRAGRGKGGRDLKRTLLPVELEPAGQNHHTVDSQKDNASKEDGSGKTDSLSFEEFSFY
jgi:hypothetical protein